MSVTNNTANYDNIPIVRRKRKIVSYFRVESSFARIIIFMNGRITW